MNFKPITHTEARRWLRAHFSGFSIPRGAVCWFVSGVQYTPARGNCYLVATDNGLAGVYIVRTAKEAKGMAA